MSVTWQTNVNPTPPGTLSRGTSNGEYGRWFGGTPSASPMLARPLRRSSSVRVSGSGNGSNVYQGAFAPKPPPRPMVGTLDRQYYPQYVTKISTSDGDSKHKPSTTPPSSDIPSQTNSSSTQLPITRRPMETPLNSPNMDKQQFVSSNKPLAPISSEQPVTKDSSTNTQISPRFTTNPFASSSLRRNHTMSDFDARRRMAEFENQRKMQMGSGASSALARTGTFSEYDRNRKENGIDHFDGNRYRTLPDAMSNWQPKDTSDDILHRAARTKLTLGSRGNLASGTSSSMSQGLDQIDAHPSPVANPNASHASPNWTHGAHNRQSPGSYQSQNSPQINVDSTDLTSRARYSPRMPGTTGGHEGNPPPGTSTSSHSIGPFPVSPSNLNNYKQMMANSSSPNSLLYNQSMPSSTAPSHQTNHLSTSYRPTYQPSYMATSHLNSYNQPNATRNFSSNHNQSNNPISNPTASNLEADYRQANSIASKLIAPNIQKLHNVQVHIHNNNNMPEHAQTFNHVETPPAPPLPIPISTKKTKSILKKKSSYESHNYRVDNAPVMNGTLKMGSYERTLPHLRHNAAALGNFGYLTDPHTVATVTIPDRKRSTSSGKRVTFAF